MRKQEFIDALRKGLRGLPAADLEERIAFYSEMIDDRMEEGLSEEEAVAGLGTVEEVISRIASETPLVRLVGEKVRPKRSLQVWEIVLLVLGAPIWLSLLIGALAVVLSLYITLWSLVITLFALNFSFAVGGLACIAGSVVYLVMGNAAGAGCVVGAGFVCVGLAILFFFACFAAGKGIVIGTGSLLLRIKTAFAGKGERK